MNKELLIIALNYFSKWVLMRAPLALLYGIYSIIWLLVLVCFFWLLIPLEKIKKEPKWLYNCNDVIVKWFNSKIRH